MMGVPHTFLLMILAATQLTPCTCGVNTTWMRTALTEHFSQARHHVTNPQYKQQAMTFIRDQFRSYGLETHVHTFATAVSNVTGINVIGILKGRYFNTSHDSIVGIGAHYDTMRHSPGVDDNGAAVVTMLQAARVLAQRPNRNYTVLFIAFDFEEWEYPNNTLAACHDISCGSKSLVTQWLANFWTLPIGWQGIFVMDTIMNFDSQNASQHFPPGVGQAFPVQASDIRSDGGRGDFITIAGRQQDHKLLSSFNASWSSLGQPQFEVESFTIPALSKAYGDFLRSDHYIFWVYGYNAIFITDTANLRGYMTTCYHHECDDIQRVTSDMINFAAKTCRTLISLVNKMSPVVDDTSSSCGLVGSGLMTASLTLLTWVLSQGFRF